MTSYQKQDPGLQLGKNGDLTIICCEYLVLAQVLKKADRLVEYKMYSGFLRGCSTSKCDSCMTAPLHV